MSSKHRDQRVWGTGNLGCSEQVEDFVVAMTLRRESESGNDGPQHHELGDYGFVEFRKQGQAGGSDERRMEVQVGAGTRLAVACFERRRHPLQRSLHARRDDASSNEEPGC